MPSLSRSSFALAAFLLPLFAQSPPLSESAEPVIRSTVREVLLDVVVRGKNEQFARKLKASDFTVTEDGVSQNIKTFRFITGKESKPAIQPAQVSSVQSKTATPAEAPRLIVEPTFISIVIDQVSPDSRKFTRDAIVSFLNQEMRPSTYIGIFTLDYQLSVVQTFTDNRDLLLKAVNRAALGNFSSLARDNANVLNQTDYQVSSGPGGVSVSSSIDLTKTTSLGSGDASVSIDQGAQAAASIIAGQRDVAMYQGGMRTVAALGGIVKYESALPGRKTVLYLSEGLNLPPDYHEMIWNVISAANRARVTFYSIDVRGLLPGNPDNLAINLANAAASVSAAQESHPIYVTPAMAKQQDTVAESLVSNTQQNMTELAHGTGGFAITNTNEIGKAMLHVMEDVRTHYEISYVPTSDVYDGHFRKIRISLDKPKLTVQSREGYFALPDLNGQAVLPFEMAGLRALDSKPLPHAFDFHLAAMRFRPMESGFSYEVAFDIPTANLTPRVMADPSKVRLHATFLALIKDSRGGIVDKVSREIDRQVPADKIDQFSRGDIFFTTPVSLVPGRYTVEAAAVDPESNRASTKRSVLFVPRRAALSLSDVALVHDLSPLTDPRNLGDPLEFDGGKITPELDGRAETSAGASLYFVVYPGADLGKPKVTIRFFRDGVEVAHDEPSLGSPDEINSIPVIASAKLPAGEYQAQVTVQQGNMASRRATAFTVTTE